MAARLATTDAVEPSMSHQDIADYLGLTMETVSRTLTYLETKGGRSRCRDLGGLSELRDRTALRSFNS